MSVQFNASGTVVDTINDYFKSLKDNPPWAPVNAYIASLIAHPPWVPVNAYIAGLIDHPPWAPINDFIQGSAAGKPSLQTVDTYLKELNSRLPAKLLTSGVVDQLKPYCGMAGSYAGKGLATTSANVPVVPAGVPVTLTALAPLPGASLPAVGSVAAGTLPPSSIVTFQWHISIASGSPLAPGALDARPGTTLDDIGGAFECVSGSLTSPLLELIPWPDPNHGTSSGVSTPSTTVRNFAAYLDISIWWPGLSSAVVVSTSPIFFAVQSWNDVLSGSVDNSKGVWNWNPAKPDPSKGEVFASQFFGSLFDLVVDDVAPVAGKIVTATITRADSKPVLPQTISSIVQRDPNLKIQAGLDVGAVLNNLKNVGNLITGSSGSSSAAFDSALSVSQVLSNALSIPVAVALNGTDLAKTMIPNSPVTLPNLVSSADASALAGIIPIGKLMTRIESKLDEDHLSIADIDGVLRQGLSFLPVPIFSNLSTRALLTGPTVTISISLKAEITVPGASQPLKLNYSVGSFSIRRPVIPIPQLALMFSAPLTGGGAQQNQDVLIVPDPVVRSLLGSPDSLRGALNTLKQTITTIRNVVPVFPNIILSIPDFDNVANTVVLMVEQLSNAAAHGKTFDPIGPYSHNNGFNSKEPSVISSELPVDRWWDGRNTDSANNNISAFLYLGISGTQDWQMRMGLDDRSSAIGRMFMPTRDNTSRASVRFLGPVDVSEGVTFRNMDNANSQVVDSKFTWNDRIRWVEWLPPLTT